MKKVLLSMMVLLSISVHSMNAFPINVHVRWLDSFGTLLGSFPMDINDDTTWFDISVEACRAFNKSEDDMQYLYGDQDEPVGQLVYLGEPVDMNENVSEHEAAPQEALGAMAVVLRLFTPEEAQLYYNTRPLPGN